MEDWIAHESHLWTLVLLYTAWVLVIITCDWGTLGLRQLFPSPTEMFFTVNELRVYVCDYVMHPHITAEFDYVVKISMGWSLLPSTLRERSPSFLASTCVQSEQYWTNISQINRTLVLEQNGGHFADGILDAFSSMKISTLRVEFRDIKSIWHFFLTLLNYEA